MIRRLAGTLTSHPVQATIVVGFVVLLMASDEPTVQNTLALSMIWTFWAFSLNVIWGYAGQFSMAQVALGGVSAYVLALLVAEQSWPTVPSALAGIGAAVVVSAVIGFVSLRQEGFRFAIMTLAFALAGVGLVGSLEVTGKSSGLIVSGVMPMVEVGPLTWDMGGSDGGFTLLMLLIFLVLVAAMRALLATSPGGGLLAIREDALLAEASGVRPWRSRILAFVLSAGVAGFAGLFQAQYYSFVYPSMFSFTTLVTVIVVLVLGGRGTLLGPFVGGLVYSVLTNAFNIGGDFEAAIFGVLVILLTVHARSGLTSLIGRLERWLAMRLKPRWVSAPAPEPSKIATPGARDLTTLAPPVDNGTARLTARDLTKSYGGVAAVDSVSFELQQGEILGVIGPNGAGKTTLFNLLSGFARPDSGTVTWDRRDVTRTGAARLSRQGLVRTFQQPRSFAALTVRHNLEIAAQRRGPLQEGQVPWAVDPVISFFDLEHLAEIPASKLSYGDAKRLGLALAVVRTPDIVLLDEPAAGLPHHEVERLCEYLERLRSLGMTVCVVEHHMDLIMRVSDRVMVLDAGSVVLVDRPDTVRRDTGVIEAYLGEPV